MQHLKAKRGHIIIFLMLVLALTIFTMVIKTSITFTSNTTDLSSIAALTSDEKLPRNEILRIVGDDEWKLKSLIVSGVITKPIKNFEPKIRVDGRTQLMLIMKCGRVVQWDSTNKSDATKNFTINDAGDIHFLLNQIGGALVLCPNKQAEELGDTVFMPALKEHMAFYYKNNRLILQSADKQSSFVFIK